MAVDTSGLRRQLLDGGARVTEAAAQALARDIDATSAPVDTGELVGSGRVATVGTVATLTYDAEHASFQDDGTGPHEIRGNPYLAFSVGGVNIVVRSVQHPGSTKNKGWFSDRTQEWPEFVQREIDAGGLDG